MQDIHSKLARLLALGVLAGALLGAAWPVMGQSSGLPSLPGMPKPASPAKATDAASAASAPALANDPKERERLTRELADIRTWNNQLSDADLATSVPAGITREEVDQAIRKLTQWTIANEGKLRALDGIETARAELAVTQAAQTAWNGPATKPPFSILLVDDWARDADSRRIKIAALDASNRMADRELLRLGDTAKKSGGDVRRLEEVARTSKPDQQAAAQWRLQAARWAESAVGATMAAVLADQQWTRDKIAVEQAKLVFLGRKLAAVAGQVSFSEQDMEQIRRIEQTRRGALEKESTQAGTTLQRRTRDLEAATSALQRLQSARPPASAEQLAVAEARVRATRAGLETARRDIEMLTSLETLLSAERVLWGWRFDALNATDAAARLAAAASLRKGLEDVRVWKAFAEGQVSVIQSEIAEQAVRQERVDLAPDVQRQEAAVTDAMNQRALRMQQLQDEIDRVDHTVGRWLDEIGGGVKDLPWTEQAALAWNTFSGVAQSIWRFELFAVEDTIDVQGRKVTVSRGVTVGKSIGAALIFIFGYLLAARLARRLERLLISRFGVGAAQARTVRRWVLALVAFVLLVLTLNLAQIPLTVFAFMGGALAIGVGFGTQTIIKNFISGLILLMERQIRVGDIVDIDGTTGTVTEVNLRSSTIRSFDGIAAIVPNSNLLEGKVTNWTMSDPRVRRVVRVGVSYGSPSDEVARRLLECAQRHGLVLKDPEPQVLFEDFADSAMVFALFFWIDLAAGTAGTKVMSDLRFMIEKSLAEGGISMPFPQRDVHLDTSRPVQVELTRSSA